MNLTAKPTVIVFVLLLSGCETMSRADIAYQTLHLIDAAQTYNMVGDDCYKETDPVTRQLIGEQPSKGEVIAWAVGVGVGHYMVSRWLEQHAPRWVQTSWGAITIGSTSYQVYDNHDIGVRPWGSNQPSASFAKRHCP